MQIAMLVLLALIFVGVLGLNWFLFAILRIFMRQSADEKSRSPTIGEILERNKRRMRKNTPAKRAERWLEALRREVEG